MDIKILIVDDSKDKTISIIDYLISIGVSRSLVDTARDAHDARSHLRSRRYDLLILDMAIPDRIENLESIDIGLDLLEEISERKEYYSPDYIICITALDEGLEQVRAEFFAKHWQLIEYKNNPDVWKTKVRDLILYINRKREISMNPSYNYDVLIFCALPTPELSNVHLLDYNWQNENLLNGLIPYRTGEISIDGVTISIVSSHASGMGMVSTVSTVTQLLEYFKPRIAIMSGISAGFDSSVGLGDIVIGDPVWDYQTGKTIQQDGAIIQKQEIRQLRLNPGLAGKLSSLARSTSIENELEKGWIGDPPATRNRIKIAPMVSGSAVISAELVMQTISEQDRKMAALDMEAYGFIYACENYQTPNPMSFVTKTVVDFGDSSKSNFLQKYGSYVSARFVDKFIRSNANYIKSIS